MDSGASRAVHVEWRIQRVELSGNLYSNSVSLGRSGCRLCHATEVDCLLKAPRLDASVWAVFGRCAAEQEL